MPVTSVASKTLTTKETQHDVPLPEIAAPKEIQQALLASFPSFLPSPDPYSGKFLDASSGLDSEDQKPKLISVWHRNNTDS